MDDINRVARVMVDAEAPADLEARIRGRLDEASETRVRRAWGTWQIAAGVCAAAAITLLVWVPGPGSRVPGPEVLGSGSPEVLGSGGVPAVAQNAKAGPESRVQVRSARASARAAASPAVSAEELAWMDRRIPALDPVVALELDQLVIESSQPEPLSITPLIMTALPIDGGTSERHNERW